MHQFRPNSGTAIFLIALTFLMLAGVTGAAVDYGRGLLLKSELRNALDAAALAGGTVATSANRNAIIQKYFDVNFPSGYMGSSTSPLNISIDATNSILTVSATSTLNYSLFKVVRSGNIQAAGSTQVTLQKRGLEIALVMDNTGSMNGTNFQSMRAAALLLIDTLYGTNETVPNLYVSLVPYTASVNIGSNNSAWTTGVNAANYSPSTWKGCVAARTNEMTDDTPAVGGLWPPYLYPSAYENNGSGTPNNCWSSTGTGCTSGIFNDASSGSGFSTTTGSLNGATNSTYPVTNTSSYKINPNQAGANNGRGPNLGCGGAITPLLQSKTTIKAAINNMDSWHRGGTLSDIGLAWGWRALSPKWVGMWSGSPNTLPLPYHTPLMDKVIIILTDGDNGFYQNNYTAYGRRNLPSNSSTPNNIFNTTNSGTITTSVNTRLTNLCTTIKAQGVLIYSITYTGSANATIQNLFRDCASNPAYYFNAPNSGTISSVFQQIGDSLNNLRISQ